MDPINAYTQKIQDHEPSIRSLTIALAHWASRSISQGVVVHPNGEWAPPSINLQSKRKLFENLSRLLASGCWFSPEKLEYPQCEVLLTDPLTRLSRTLRTLWMRKVIKDPRTRDAYEILQRDIKIVRIWLKQVKSLGKICLDLNRNDLGIKPSMKFEEIGEILKKLHNWNLCSLPSNFSNFNTKLVAIKRQALDLAKKQFDESLSDLGQRHPDSCFACAHHVPFL